jgi:hypothetical protein
MSMARNTSHNQRAPPPREEDVFMTLVRNPPAVDRQIDDGFLPLLVWHKLNTKEIYVLFWSLLPSTLCLLANSSSRTMRSPDV